MIRGSTAIATAALLLSLSVHFLGLGFSSPLRSERPPALAATDAVAVGNAFEDVAEAPSEPVRPESAPAPEPPVETPPEPDLAEIPTTEAFVASANPQRAITPDTNPETIRPSEPEQGAVPQPETLEPSGSDDGAVPDAALPPPVEFDAAEPALSPPIAEAPKQLAVSPVPITTVSPAPIVNEPN